MVAKKKVKTKEKCKCHNSAVAIPACLLIGIGTGILIGQTAAFTLIGLGVGFLLMYLKK